MIFLFHTTPSLIADVTVRQMTLPIISDGLGKDIPYKLPSSCSVREIKFQVLKHSQIMITIYPMAKSMLGKLRLGFLRLNSKP